nr:MAG TPA: Cell cycle protein [Caudoviricetes sp.]
MAVNKELLVKYLGLDYSEIDRFLAECAEDAEFYAENPDYNPGDNF